MLKELKKISENSDKFQLQDLKKAAAYLLSHQFIYADNRNDKRHYHVIAEHFDYFQDLFEALNWQLEYLRDYECIGLVPDADQEHLKLKADESLLLLTLRLIYEEEVERFNAEQGSVWLDSESWLSRYETQCKRERPHLSHFREIMALFSRHGIIEREESDEDNRLYSIRIRPVIRFIMTEDYLRQLEQFMGINSDELSLDDLNSELDESISDLDESSQESAA